MYGTNNITGCRNKDTVTIKVNSLPIANAGLDKTINAGQNVQIGTNVISGMSYLWTPSLNLNSSIIAKPIANPTSTTNYIVKVTNDITRCDKQDTMVLTVNGLPRLSSYSSETKTTILVERISNEMLFNLSPNPANNIVKLSYEIVETEADVKLKLLDINGQLIKEIVIDTPQLKGEINLDLSELVTGVYFINLQSNNQTAIKKLVVQK